MQLVHTIIIFLILSFLFIEGLRLFSLSEKEWLIEKNKRDSINVIYRRSQKNSLIETKQETEYLAYSLFQGTDVPVPKLILFEDSSQSLGAPFLVMEELEGEAASPFDSEVYKPFEEEIGNQFWIILGKIASL